MNGDDDGRDDASEAGGSEARERGNDASEADGGGESGWRFALDEVGPDGVTEDTATPEREPIEPGDIDPEHAVLVALGVAITVGVFLVGL